MAYFAIYKTATGDLVSDETDEAAGRLSDNELSGKGLTRVSIAGPFDSGFTWNPTSKQRVARTPAIEEQDAQRDKELASAIVRKGGQNLSLLDTNTLVALVAKYIVK